MKKINLGALKIVLVYVILSIAWIFYSDIFIVKYANQRAFFVKISIFKGFFFIFITAVLLYVLIKKETERRIKIWEYFATYDIMTGAYNRNAGLEILEKIFEKHKKENKDLSIIYADINNLKQVNDTLGHHEGDRLIINVVDVLKKNIRNSDYVVRIGGDEFLIILPNCNSLKAENIIIRIKEALKELNLKNQKVEHSVSFGVASLEDFYKTTDEMIAFADMMMYKDKKNYKEINLQPA